MPAASAKNNHRRVYTGSVRWLLLVSLAGLPILGLSNTTGDFEANSQIYQNQIELNAAELKKIQQEITEAENQRKLLQSQLTKQKADVDGRAARVNELQANIGSFEDKLRSFEQRVALLQISMAEDRKRLAKMLQSSMYTAQDSGWKLLFDQSDPTMAARVGVYIEYIMQAQQERISVHAERMSNIAMARDEALKSRNWLQHIKSKADSQRVAYARKRSKSQAALQQLKSALQTNRQSADEIATEQQELKVLLEQLAEAARNKSGFFESRKARHRWPTWPNSRAAKAKMPVLKARFGDKKASGKLKWSGLLISAKSGSTVHAIADGEVVYADSLAGLGQLVVLEHGDGYLSLYGGNDKLLVESEDWVESGATIATVGKTGGPNPQGIYLEIRHDANPVDPEQWLAPKAGHEFARN